MASKEEILAKFTAIPVKQKVLITAVVVIAIALGYWATIYKRQQSDFNALLNQISQLDEKINKARGIANNLKKFREQVAQLNQQMKEALSLLPNSSDIPDLLTRIAGMSEKSSLLMIKFKLEEEVPQDFYAEVPVSMEVLGNYHEVAVFFDKVSKVPRIINVQNLEMLDPQPYNQKMRLKSSFSVVTYRFLSEDEIKARENAAMTGGGAPPP